MDKKQRIVLLVFCLLLFLLVVILFWPFVASNILAPLAVSAWLFLRIFVLSVDQKVYWALLILIGLFLILRRFFLVNIPQLTQPEAVEGNETINRAYMWRGDFAFGERTGMGRQTLQREMMKLIVSLYSSRLQGNAYFDVYEPLKQKQIVLPDRVYAFLFYEDPVPSGSALLKWFQSLQQTVRKQIRAWSGQERRDYDQAINEILTFMENELEITNGDE